MKQIQFRKWTEVYIFMGILVVLISAPVSAGGRDDSYINEAYQLRMNGKADSAETVLRKHLMTDSTNALAWFELARTKNHIFNSKPDLSQKEWNEIIGFAEKAASLDPTNETFAYYRSLCRLLDAFLSIMMGQQDALNKVNTACESFQSVLQINPQCTPAMLYQVEFYGMLPPEMGGNKEHAQLIAEKLEKIDKTCYQIARARLLPDTADFSLFWSDAEKETGSNAQVLEELGRGFLFKSDAEKGEQYYMEAIQIDPSKSYLNMNLARYYLMMSRQNPAMRDNYLQKAEERVLSYLQSQPEPLSTYKAHAYCILGMISSFRGDESSSTKYNNMASGIDRFCSKASGMPLAIVYYPPDQVEIKYSSFFMPF